MDKTNACISIAGGLITAVLLAHTSYNPVALFIVGAGVAPMSENVALRLFRSFQKPAVTLL